MGEPKDPYLIESAARILDVLTVLRRSCEKMTLGQIAGQLRLPTSTAFRLLRTLEQRSYVERIPESRFYRLRPRPQIGLAVTSSSISFTAEITRSLRTAAASSDVDVLLTQNGFDRQRTLANVEELLATKVDLIMEVNSDPSVGSRIAGLCRRAGVPLIALVYPLPGAITFAVDVYRAGFDGGIAVGEAIGSRWCGDLDSVLLLNVKQPGTVPQSRLAGMLHGVRTCIELSKDRIHLLVTARDPAVQGRLIYDRLANQCGRKTLVLAANDTLALAAADAARHFGPDREILILGQGGVEAVRQELKRRGTALWGTISHFPERFGAQVLPVALRLLAGEQIPLNHTLRHAVLTSENLQRYFAVN